MTLYIIAISKEFAIKGVTEGFGYKDIRKAKRDLNTLLDPSTTKIIEHRIYEVRINAREL